MGQMTPEKIIFLMLMAVLLLTYLLLVIAWLCDAPKLTRYRLQAFKNWLNPLIALSAAAWMFGAAARGEAFLIIFGVALVVRAIHEAIQAVRLTQELS